MSANKRWKPKKPFRRELDSRLPAAVVRALRPHGDINSARRADIYRSRRDHSQNIPQTIGYISLLVRDYDDAITFFTQSLDFHLIEDTPSKDRQGRDKRWVLIAPPGSKGTKILLARASNEEEATRIGNQTGGRVFLFLHTDDFWRDYNRMKEKGVRFIREPKQEEYGKVTVFEDLYGNQWDLLEPKPLSP